MNNKKKNKLRGYQIRVEDLDNDPKTLDDVIIIDWNGTFKYVSGYHFNTGLNRRKAAVLYHNFPIKKEVKELHKQLQKDPKLKKSFYKYLSDQNKNANHITLFSEWNPPAMPVLLRPYPKLVKFMYSLDVANIKNHRFIQEIRKESIRVMYLELKAMTNGNKEQMMNILNNLSEDFTRNAMKTIFNIANEFDKQQGQFPKFEFKYKDPPPPPPPPPPNNQPPPPPPPPNNPPPHLPPSSLPSPPPSSHFPPIAQDPSLSYHQNEREREKGR
jgi:hypothetical protein